MIFKRTLRLYMMLGLLLLFLVSELYAFNNKYVFESLSVSEGLSQSTVFAIEQDKKGFMWFGTRTGGLNRYDGASMKIYKNDPDDPNSISGNEVLDILEDSQGRYWIATRNKGINRFDFKEDRFYPYLNTKVLGNKRDFHTVTAIVEDYKGRIWAGTQGGLFLYHPEEDNFVEAINQNTCTSFRGNSSICLVRDSLLCIGTKAGALLMNTNTRQIVKKYNHDPLNINSLSGDNVTSFFYDSKDQLWIGTRRNGLNLYSDLLNDSAKHFKHTDINPESISTNIIRDIYEDKKGNIWVCTPSGLNQLTPDEIHSENPEFIRHLNDPGNSKSLFQDILFTFFEDSGGNYWVGTWSRGVNYVNIHHKKFDLFTSSRDQHQGVQNDNITSFTENKSGIWIGTAGGGISLLNRKKNYFEKHINRTSSSSQISSNFVRSLYSDSDHCIWIGTFEGLTYYNSKEDTSKVFLKDYIINSITHGINNELWIGTSSGLINFNKKDYSIKEYFRDDFISTELADNNITVLFTDQNNDIWLGTKNGLHLYNRTQDNFIRYQYSPENVSTISNNYIVSINTDNNGTLWVGTYNGLNKFNPKDQSFKRYNEKNGLPDNVIQGILTDEHNQLWLSTNKGLTRMHFQNNNDKEKITFRYYSEDDGLQGDEFMRHSYYKTKNGEMLFGGTHGFNIFHPDSIIDNSTLPNIVFTQLYLYNKPVTINDESGLLNKNIALTETLTLTHKQSVISFEFAALNFSASKKIEYAYMMEGFDKDWVYIGNKHEAHYTNLPPGKYTFKIIASNSDGIWNTKGASIQLTVLPPWWKTWWFRLLLITTIILFLVSIYYYRLRSVERKNITLDKMVKSRTKLLRKANEMLQERQEEIIVQNEELENHRTNLENLVQDRTIELEIALKKAKESDELKSAFMANMSHEIRTPMNAILGFSNLLNDEEITSDERRGYIDIIQSNSETLLILIDEIIDMSLIESNQLKIRKENFDLNSMLDNIFSYYYLSNKSSNVKIRKRNLLNDLNLVLYSDVVRLKQIITNLMDNAVKFTNDGYITVGAYHNDKDFFIYVEDTGRGIPAKDIHQIFKQFTKVEDNISEWTHGLGLGLAISQKISNALDGELLVESTEGVGSKFTFSIPVNKITSNGIIKVDEIKSPIINKWTGKTILIVEDVEANYIYFKKVLNKADINIIWAKNGKEAFDKVSQTSKIDLVLMDIKMPIMDGYTAAKKIKEYNPSQVIVAQTAYARPEEKLKFFDDNFDEYLAKPISIINLRMVLEKYL